MCEDTMTSGTVIDEQVRVYRPAFLEHGDSPLATHQNNPETQHLRFERLTAHLLDDATHNTIEDIGCGICDLYDYLRKRNANVTYSGTEIVTEMVSLAHHKYPEITIQNRDILSCPVTETYDFVVLSGTFNMPGRVPREEWKAFCHALITAMFKMCRKAISFNFLTAHSTFYAPHLFYLDPSEVLDFCLRTLSRFVELRHNYPLYEGTITVYKENHVRQDYMHPAFDKYFSPVRESTDTELTSVTTR